MTARRRPRPTKASTGRRCPTPCVLAHEALELLKTHYITFPLPNAPHILDIKQGKLPYKAVAEEIEGLTR